MARWTRGGGGELRRYKRPRRRRGRPSARVGSRERSAAPIATPRKPHFPSGVGCRGNVARVTPPPPAEHGETGNTRETRGRPQRRLPGFPVSRPSDTAVPLARVPVQTPKKNPSRGQRHGARNRPRRTRDAVARRVERAMVGGYAPMMSNACSKPARGFERGERQRLDISVFR